MYKHKFEKKLIIMVGNIGSGKSTYIKKLNDEYIVLSRDAIRYMFGDGNYIFDKKLEQAVVQANFTAFDLLLESGVNLVIDETNIDTWMRDHYMNTAKKAGYYITAVILPKISQEESVARRMKKPHGAFKAEDWMAVWKKFNDMYEEPTQEEGFDEIIMLNN